jgi:hypothetical protein
MKVKVVEMVSGSDINSTIFTSGSSAYHIVSTNIVDYYDFYEDMITYYQDPLTTFNDLISYHCETGHFMSKDDNWYGSVGIAFASCDANQTSGTLIESDYSLYPNYVVNANAGSWEIINIDGSDTLVAYPSDTSSYSYNPVFRVVDGVMKRGELEKAETGFSSYDFDINGLREFNSYFGLAASNYPYQSMCEQNGFVWSGTSCIEPSFYQESPKVSIFLEPGYNYVSLRSNKTLCSETISSTHSFCDQNNTLESLFTSNPHVEKLYKHRGSWSYFDGNSTGISSNTIMNKFITANYDDALLIETNSSTQVDLPYSVMSSDDINYSTFSKDKWYLLSAHSDMSVTDVKSAVENSSSKTLKYVMRLKNGVWSVYAPTNDADVDSTVVRLNSLQAYDSYWLLLQ